MKLMIWSVFVIESTGSCFGIKASLSEFWFKLNLTIFYSILINRFDWSFTNTVEVLSINLIRFSRIVNIRNKSNGIYFFPLNNGAIFLIQKSTSVLILFIYILWHFSYIDPYFDGKLHRKRCKKSKTLISYIQTLNISCACLRWFSANLIRSYLYFSFVSSSFLYLNKKLFS